MSNFTGFFTATHAGDAKERQSGTLEFVIDENNPSG